MKWNKKSMKLSGIFRENMKIIILLSSIVLVSAPSADLPPRSVNVALETSFLFEPKDAQHNLSFIKNIKAFLDKLNKILTPHERTPKNYESTPEDGRRFWSFTDVVKKFGENFLNYTGAKLKDAVKVIHVEVNNIAEATKSKYNDLKPNREPDDHNEGTNVWRRTDPEVLQNTYRKIMNENKPLIHSFARRMNDYYSEDDVKKLFNIIRKLDTCLENQIDASKVVKELFHFGILNKYKKLNKTSRANLMKDLKFLSRVISKKMKTTEHLYQRISVRTKYTPPFEVTTRGTEVKVLDEQTDNESHELFRELENIIEMALKHTAGMTTNIKQGANNEVVVGNVELIVQPVEKPSR